MSELESTIVDKKRAPTVTFHALSALRRIAAGSEPRKAFNPGVASRLLRDGLAAPIMEVSPFKIHNGAKIEFLQITSEGSAILEAAISRGELR